MLRSPFGEPRAVSWRSHYMTNCLQCGAVDQNSRFCVQCGAALPAPAPYAPTTPTAPTVTEPAVYDTVLRRGPASPAAEPPQFGGVSRMPPAPVRPANAPQRSGRVAGWWIVC